MTATEVRIRELQDRVRELQAPVDELEHRLREAQTTVTLFASQKRGMLAQPDIDCDELARLNAAIEVAENRHEQLKARLAEARKPLDRTWAEINRLQEKRAAEIAEDGERKLDAQIDKLAVQIFEHRSAANAIEQEREKLLQRRNSLRINRSIAQMEARRSGVPA